MDKVPTITVTLTLDQYAAVFAAMTRLESAHETVRRTRPADYDAESHTRARAIVAALRDSPMAR